MLAALPNSRPISHLVGRNIKLGIAASPEKWTFGKRQNAENSFGLPRQGEPADSTWAYKCPQRGHWTAAPGCSAP
jgi:hypothetical protein